MTADRESPSPSGKKRSNRRNASGVGGKRASASNKKGSASKSSSSNGDAEALAPRTKNLSATVPASVEKPGPKGGLVDKKRRQTKSSASDKSIKNSSGVRATTPIAPAMTGSDFGLMAENMAELVDQGRKGAVSIPRALDWLGDLGLRQLFHELGRAWSMAE